MKPLSQSHRRRRASRALVPLALLTLAAGACGRSVQVTSPGAPTMPSAPAITDGRSLLAAMRRAHEGRWYRTLSYTQSNTLIAASGRETRSEWRHRAEIPGKLRIDYLPLASRSGVLYDGTRVQAIDNGKVVNAQPGVNAYLLLTADVYVRPPEETATLLEGLGFDLSKVRRAEWEGAPAWVLGAAAGDTSSSQVWIDAARLLVRRVIQAQKAGARTVLTEARFSDWRDVGGYPVAHAVELRRDGRPYFREVLRDVQVDVPLEPGTFVVR